MASPIDGPSTPVKQPQTAARTREMTTPIVHRQPAKVLQQSDDTPAQDAGEICIRKTCCNAIEVCTIMQLYKQKMHMAVDARTECWQTSFE